MKYDRRSSDLPTVLAEASLVADETKRVFGRLSSASEVEAERQRMEHRPMLRREEQWHEATCGWETPTCRASSPKCVATRQRGHRPASDALRARSRDGRRPTGPV